MSGLWLAGLAGPSLDLASAASTVAPQAANLAYEQREAVRELTYQVQRLSLLNQALWELLRTRLSLTDEDLLRLAGDIDLRDGIEDGQMTARAVRCPSCQRISNSKHYKCIYCSQEFERPVFG